ncbi:reverse transcriptase domain, reverse transcriptase zinc-binding domain protein [Tanacetum coccineum]
MQVLMIQNDRENVIMWRDREGVLRHFFVPCAWDTIRLRADVVNWYNVVWFPHCIPRDAIHLWLVVKQKLKTQDRLRQWDVGPDIDLNLLKCPLCNLNERNSRLFKKKVALADHIVQVICHIVRLKLVSFKFKKVSARSRILLDHWKAQIRCIFLDRYDILDVRTSDS